MGGWTEGGGWGCCLRATGARAHFGLSVTSACGSSSSIRHRREDHDGYITRWDHGGYITRWDHDGYITRWDHDGYITRWAAKRLVYKV